MTAPTTLLALVEEARRWKRLHTSSAGLVSSAGRCYGDLADALEALIPLQPQDERKVTREEIARELAWQLGDTMGDARGVFLSSEMHTNGAHWLKAADAILALLNREGRGS